MKISSVMNDLSRHSPIYNKFLQHVENQPDTIALISDKKTMNYQDVRVMAEKISSGIIKCGGRSGDRIVVSLSNRIELVPVYLACLFSGLILVTINQRQSVAEASYILTNSAPRFYLSDKAQHVKWKDVVAKQATIECGWLIDGDDIDSQPTLLEWNNLIAEDYKPNFLINDNALATIFYTSGTTGKPKGVVYSQKTLDAAAAQLSEMFKPISGKNPGPGYNLCSMFDLIVPWNIVMTLAAMTKGCAIVVSEQVRPSEIFQLLKNGEISWLSGPPSTFQALLDAHHDHVLDGEILKNTNCVSGGDACSTELTKQIYDVFSGRMQSCYGQTEIGPVLFHGDLLSAQSPSIGMPVTGVEVKIDNADGGPGPLALRAPSLAVGLWNGSEVERFEAGRWLSTEDVVQKNSDGNLEFFGRTQDLIKIGGYATSPLELEKHLRSHPKIDDAVVFSVPDKVNGSRIISIIKLSDDIDNISIKNIADFSYGKIASYKIPSELIIAEKIPTMASGKISRVALAKEYIEQKSA